MYICVLFISSKSLGPTMFAKFPIHIQMNLTDTTMWVRTKRNVWSRHDPIIKRIAQEDSMPKHIVLT